jgi:lipid II isoglutaminyl synthase (glutamine-hydrolysing)
MRIRLSITIIISKFIIKACRLIKLGGTSLPGEIARKIYPGIVREVTKDFNIIMVTGTNGKTTTTRIIGQILTENGIKYISNKSGANLVDGITTTFIQAVDIWGKCDSKTALIEIDEAAFDKMTNYVEPDILVVTNFFRDQLDRFGELYTTLKRVKSGIEKSKKAKLILNADDSLCASIGTDIKRDVIYFGMGIDSVKNPE